MKSNGDIFEGNIFPITENDSKEFYVTNAPYSAISECFFETERVSEYIEELRSRGYKINKYKPSIYLNFDEK